MTEPSPATDGGAPETFPHRRHLLNLPEFAPSVLVWEFQAKTVRAMATLLAYTHRHPSRGRERISMDVEQLARQWCTLIVRTVTAHSKDDWDHADFDADQLFGPVLTAPIAEVRLFTTRLAAMLEADERVPFRVWSGFRSINDVLIQKVADQGVIELKSRLARQVAELAEESVPTGDWIDAMADALQWRDPDALATMETALKSGKRPRVRGRESCLFLIVNEGEPDEHTVML